MNDNSEMGKQIPFQYSITDPQFSPVNFGTMLAVKSALLLALVYSMVIALPLGLSMRGLSMQEVSMREFPHSFNIHRFDHVIEQVGRMYQLASLVGGFAYLAGLLPALMVAGLSGWLIGMLFRHWVPHSLLPRQAIVLGFCASAVLLLGRLWLIWLWAPTALGGADVWVAWYGPNLLAFVGLWWVVYRVNEQMAFSIGAAPLNGN